MKDVPAKVSREAEKVAVRSGRRTETPDSPGRGRGRPVSMMNARALMRLQSSAGNAAVARLVSGDRGAQQTSNGSGPAADGFGGLEAAATNGSVVASGTLVAQRKGDPGSCPPPPPPPAPADPHADPKFAKVEADVKGKGKGLKQHPPAAAEAKKAQDAAQPPSDDRASQAKAAQADKMAAAKPKGFDKAAFVAAVKKAIAAAAPKNLDEADKFANSSKPDEIKAAVATKVTQGKDDSGKDMAEKAKQPPDPSVAKDKPVVPLRDEPAPPPAAVDGAKAMPDKAPPDQTDFRGGPCEVDSKMADAEVTEKHLEKSNEPQMQEAAKAKGEAEAHAAEAPGAIRQKEATTQKSAQAGAGADAKAALSGMVGAKGKAANSVAAQKAAAKAKEEADRKRISTEIHSIFDKTKTETEAILTGLDAKVTTAFDAGEKEAKSAFTAKHTGDMQKYKDERYSGVSGWAQWTADLFTGLPPEANQIFDRAKVVYESKMSDVISKIADLIGSELDAAKARIEKGRQEIKAYVASQPKELQKLAGETAQEVGEKFNQLESDVDAKQESLVSDLAQKYVESRNAVDEEIKAEQDKNKGLVDKAKEAVGSAVEAILKLKDLFMGLLAKAANAFTKILDDPIAFISNFMTAIKNGFMNFATNILDHLKKGLMGWLLGALASAGVEIPDSFDLKGILKMVASILGLTWSAIKARIMKIAPWIGKAIDFIESKVEVFVILATKGVVGIWDWIKDKVGDLKDMVLGPIKEFVVEKIVKSGISWVLGMLNPAGALIKIVQALIGVVQWVMERGAALAEFVSTVIGAVSDIAHGGLGGVPAKIEAALGKAVPLVISFLANLLGLGGISEKIKSILETVQKPVGKAVDFVVKGALKAAKGLVKGLFGKKKKKKDGKADEDQMDPRAVKEKAKAELAGQLGDSVAGPSPVKAAISSVYARLRPKGLKSIEVKPDTAGSFDIWVSASAKEKGPKLRLKDRVHLLERDFKIRPKKPDPDNPDKEPGNRGVSHTALIATWNGVPLPRRYSNGEDHHAERAMVLYIEKMRQAKKAENRLPSAPPGSKNHLDVILTKSPCGKCGDILRAYASAQNVALTLAPTGVYGKTPAEKQASKEVLIKLHSEGVKLRVPTLDEILSKYRGAELDPESLRILKQRLAEVEKIVQELDAKQKEMAGTKVGG